MAIRGDSYSSTAEVKAFTRHLLDGQSAFNSTTLPTATEIERFIDRASGILNVALWKNGFNPSAIRANSTAKLAADEWVTSRAVAYVELTQRGEGFSQAEGSRHVSFTNLHKMAEDFVCAEAVGFKYMGVAVAKPSYLGLAFTGLTAQKDRADPGDTSKEQPMFTRRRFDEDSVDVNNT